MQFSQLPKEKQAAIVADYQSGMGIKEIYTAHGCSQKGVYNALRRSGVGVYRRKMSPAETKRVDDFLVSARRAFPLPGLPPPSTRKQPIPFDQTAFDVVTPQAAYWAGLLMADGCVTDERAIVIQLQERDRELVDGLRWFLCSKHKQQRVLPRDSRHSPQIRMSIKSKRLAAVLAHYGIIPRKTFAARAPDFLAMHPDFWRGYLDGDGTFEVSNGTVSMVGTEALMAQFVEFNRAIFPNSMAMSDPHASTPGIRIGRVSGKSAQLFLRAIYTSPPWLDRKRRCAEAIASRHNRRL
jgi:hypothetical protein